MDKRTGQQHIEMFYIDTVKIFIKEYKKSRKEQGKLSNPALETQGYWTWVEFHGPKEIRDNPESVERLRATLEAEGYTIEPKENVIIDNVNKVALGIELYTKWAGEWIRTEKDSGVGVGSVLEPPIGEEERLPAGEPIYEGEAEEFPKGWDPLTNEPWESPNFYIKNDESRALWDFLQTPTGKPLKTNKVVLDGVVGRLNHQGYDIDIEPPAEKLEEKVMTEDERDVILNKLSELQRQKREVGLTEEEQKEYDKLSHMLREGRLDDKVYIKKIKKDVEGRLKLYGLDPDEVYITKRDKIIASRDNPTILIVDKGRDNDVLYELYNKYVRAFKGIDYVLTAYKEEGRNRELIYRKGQTDPIGLLEAEISNDPEFRGRYEVIRTDSGYDIAKSDGTIPSSSELQAIYEAYNIPDLPLPDSLHQLLETDTVVEEGGEGTEGGPGGWGERYQKSISEILRVYNTLPDNIQTNILGYLAQYSFAFASTDTRRLSAVTQLGITAATLQDGRYLHTVFPDAVAAKAMSIRSVSILAWLRELGFGFPTSLELRKEAKDSGIGYSSRYRADMATVYGVVVENEEDKKAFIDGAKGILYGVGGGRTSNFSRKATTYYFYGDKEEKGEDGEEKYIVFKLDLPDAESVGWHEGRALVKAREMGMGLSGGMFTEAGIPDDFSENYTVIDANDITEEQAEEHEQLETQEEENKQKQKLQEKGVGEKLLGWDTSETDENLVEGEWDFLKDALTDLMNERSQDGDWAARGESMGWQSKSGTAEFHAETGAELAQAILPRTDVTFYVYNYMGGKGLAINNYHHDAPTGEWYYLLPKNAVGKIKPLEQFGQQKRGRSQLWHKAPSVTTGGKDYFYTIDIPEIGKVWIVWDIYKMKWTAENEQYETLASFDSKEAGMDWVEAKYMRREPVTAREGDSGGEVLTDRYDKDNKKNRKRDYSEKRINPDNDGKHDTGAGWDSSKGNTDGQDDYAYNRLSVGQFGDRVADYEGWTNYETWDIVLIMENEKPIYNSIEELKEQTKGKMTADDAKQLAEDWYPYGTPDMQDREDLEAEPTLEEIRKGVLAMDKVNWQEVADNWNIEWVTEQKYRKHKKKYEDKDKITPLEQFGTITRFNRTYDTNYNYNKEVTALNQEE